MSRFPFLSSFHSPRPAAYQAATGGLLSRLWIATANFWDLGFTAFGGPPVHFQILHRRFVGDDNNAASAPVTAAGGVPWIDEQTYQELFAISQALPGPASTKFLFCLALIHAGFIPAVWAFLIWSLPGALGMYALAVGVQRISEVLPDPVYALLSGLNAGTVGIIAVAAVQLAEKSITDDLTRLLVIMGACAGLPYTALWYFPLLMAIGGSLTVSWDLWARARVGRMKARWKRKPRNEQREAEESVAVAAVPLQATASGGRDSGVHRRGGRAEGSREGEEDVRQPAAQPQLGIDLVSHAISVRTGLATIFGFFVTFISFMVARGVLSRPPLELDLFTNMYLAGTIIFGGGPVVIPLLREYVVVPGWVSSRDFLIGLAIIQAFPGPNFNFAVYLGALALHSPLGALLGYLGIFLPGLTLALGFQALWRAIRSNPSVVSALRGVNSTAVGLVFTAVYRLWEIGWLKQGKSASLGGEPWWVLVVAITYSAVKWWDVPPAVAIVAGAVAGLAWWGVVR